MCWCVEGRDKSKIRDHISPVERSVGDELGLAMINFFLNSQNG